MIFSFDSELAKRFGVEESIMLQNFIFWISKNKANEKHFYDGNYWTYNSNKALSELFPFWTDAQVRRILNSLINKGVIITGNYNKSSYDRTLWYAINNSVFNFENFHLSILTNGFVENDKPIPDIIPDIIPDKKEIYKESFEEFWKLFPKQRAGSKQKAYNSYCKALKEKRTTEEEILEAVKLYSSSDEVKRGYAKGCAAWINDDRFNNQYKKQEWTI